jgi:hypothetical protein
MCFLFFFFFFFFFFGRAKRVVTVKDNVIRGRYTKFIRIQRENNEESRGGHVAMCNITPIPLLLPSLRRLPVTGSTIILLDFPI